MSLSVGSVCSGIGAPECAWEPLGWRFAWSADIEPFPNAVRAHHWPHVSNLGDMTAIAARIEAGEVEAPDVLVGGTPCQSFSVAGLRKGLADARGNLALEFIRLADAIDAVRRAAGKPAAWILWENVPGVLSDAGNAFGAFLAGMVGSDAAISPRGRWTDAGVVHGPTRCAAWRILDAQHVGLAQRRQRVFMLARGGAGAWSAADALLPVIPRVRWHPAPRREAREAVARPIAAGSPGGSGYRNDADTADNLIAAFGGNNTAGPIDVAAALNACPTAAGRQDFESETFITELAPTLLANGKAAGSATQQDAETERPEGAAVGHFIPAAMAVRRLTPTECERLQGFPDGWTAVTYRNKPAADGPRYRALGNSMAVPVLAWIGRQIELFR